MNIENVINGNDSNKTMSDILNRIHSNGPISAHDFETLSYIKKYQPEIFEKYEARLISLMGLFYKTVKPNTALEQVYSIFAESIEESIGKKFTPVQADAYHKIKELVYFSFSAPTSAGKSVLFRELITRAR